MEFRFACLSLFYKYIAPLEQLLQQSHDKVRYYEKTQAFTIGH